MIKKFVKKYFQTFTFCYGYIRHRAFLIMLNSMLVGVLDGIGLALFIPLLQSAEGMEGGGSENMGKLKVLVDIIESAGLTLNLNTVLLLMLTLFLIKGGLKYWEKYYNSKVRQHFLKGIRYQLIDGMNSMRYQYFTTSDSGRIQNVLTSEVVKVMMAFNQYFMTIQNVILVLVYITLAFLSNWQFAILVLIAGVLTNFVYRALYRYTKKWSSQVSKEGHKFQAYLIQSVNYFKYLKATNGLNRYSEKLKEKVESIEDANLEIGKIGAILIGSREALTIGILLTVILIQVNFLGGTITALILSLLFFYRSMGYIMQVQTNWNTFLGNTGAMESVKEFIAEMKREKENNGKLKLEGEFESIELSELSFKYGNSEILSHINLNIQRNKTVAFVGESGSGKTTLVNIIAGLMDSFTGELKVNSINYNELDKHNWQDRIGYITQEPVIFDDTIANNISFWDDMSLPDNKARLIEAINKAAISDFINTLPEKEESRLGNNGILVSGGQKQRISIARELYKNVEVLIMDEATSALDSETEQMIQKNIDALKGQYTMIIIAHRLSTVKNADMIVVLDKGKILASGTFDELLQANEKFKKMVELQEF